MNYQFSKVILLLGFVLIANNISITEADPDTTIAEVICNPDTWGTDDPYGDNVALTLDDLVFSAPDEPDKSDYAVGTNRETTVYAFACCRQQLTTDECYSCLSEALDQFFQLCTYAIGAEIVMIDCAMRYEKYPFYG